MLALLKIIVGKPIIKHVERHVLHLSLKFSRLYSIYTMIEYSGVCLYNYNYTILYRNYNEMSAPA